MAQLHLGSAWDARGRLRQEQLQQAASLSLRHGPFRGLCSLADLITLVCSAGPREKRWERQLQSTLSQSIHTGKHPRTCIQIVIQVMHDDGSLLSAALNAATAALLDACIPMHSMFCAATVAVGSDGSQLLDPDHSEELVRISCLPGTVYQYVIRNRRKDRSICFCRTGVLAESFSDHTYLTL